MTITIDNHGGTPIYDQVCRQIRAAIQSGALAADEALPSIRSLSRDLRISVITTKRAYEELEREGLIYTVAGVGCFVAPPERGAAARAGARAGGGAPARGGEAGRGRGARPRRAARNAGHPVGGTVMRHGSIGAAAPGPEARYAFALSGIRRSFPGFTLGPLDLSLPAGCILGLVGGERRGQDHGHPAAVGHAAPGRGRGAGARRARGRGARQLRLPCARGASCRMRSACRRT